MAPDEVRHRSPHTSERPGWGLEQSVAIGILTDRKQDLPDGGGDTFLIDLGGVDPVDQWLGGFGHLARVVTG